MRSHILSSALFLEQASDIDAVIHDNTGIGSSHEQDGLVVAKPPPRLRRQGTTLVRIVEIDRLQHARACLVPNNPKNPIVVALKERIWTFQRLEEWIYEIPRDHTDTKEAVEITHRGAYLPLNSGRHQRRIREVLIDEIALKHPIAENRVPRERARELGSFPIYWAARSAGPVTTSARALHF